MREPNITERAALAGPSLLVLALITTLVLVYYHAPTWALPTILTLQLATATAWTLHPHTHQTSPGQEHEDAHEDLHNHQPPPR